MGSSQATTPPRLTLIPELAVLVAALRPPSDAGRDSCLAVAVTQTLDWPLLLRLARRHRVVPLLAAGLNRIGVRPPEDVARSLDWGTTEAALAELALAAATRDVVQALEEAAIPVVVLKGVPLSLRLHGRLGLRTSRDIDLLVAPQDAAAAFALLRRLGFAATDAQAPDPSHMRRHKDVEMADPAGRGIVELHWRLFDNRRLMPLGRPLPHIWAPLGGGMECRVLPDAVNLLYLANHGAQHGWSRLKWLADLAGLLAPLEAEGIAALVEATPRGGARRALNLAMLLCGALFDLPVPEPVITCYATDWRLRHLYRIAEQIVCESVDGEMEDQRFGTTAKNLSHYLLSASPAYLLEEALFDMAHFARGEEGWRWLGPAGRMMGWMRRHAARPRGQTRHPRR